MMGYPSFKAVDAWRHRDALNYCDMDDPRAWGHELQRGAPSGGSVYPLGWWAAGCEHQPNAEYRDLPPEQWAVVYDQLQRATPVSSPAEGFTTQAWAHSPWLGKEWPE